MMIPEIRFVIRALPDCKPLREAGHDSFIFLGTAISLKNFLAIIVGQAPISTT